MLETLIDLIVMEKFLIKALSALAVMKLPGWTEHYRLVMAVNRSVWNMEVARSKSDDEAVTALLDLASAQKAFMIRLSYLGTKGWWRLKDHASVSRLEDAQIAEFEKFRKERLA